MADLLTHVLVAYVLLTVASWRLSGLTDRWIVAGMAGAAIPDLVKVNIVVDNRVIEGVLGMQFSYGPVSSLGGVLLIAAAISLLFGERRQRVYGFLVFGGVTSLVVDGLRVFADGRSGFWLYPFTWWRPPTPSLYVTSNPLVTVSTVAAAACVFAIDAYFEPGE